MAALIGALRVSLSADTAAFQSGMKKAERQAQTSASSIQKSLGLVKAGFAGLASGLSIGLITQGIRASLDYAGSLGEVSQQLGVTTRELQTFRYAVSQNGGTIEDADKALGKFSISVSKALSGSKQAAAAFQAMGVSLDDLRSKGKSELIGQIADNMKKTGGASANAAAGVLTFGRGFQKIIPTLDQGSAGMNDLAAAADELGIVLSDEQIQNADRTADKLDSLMTVLKAKIAGDVADNTDSIFGFIDALFQLVKAAEDARAALVNFQQNYNLPNLFGKNAAFGKGVAGSSATTDLENGGTALAIAKKMGLKIAGTGSGAGSPTQFLGGGGGGGRKRSARAPKDTSLRDAFQFEEEQRRFEMDILRAKQSQAIEEEERAALAIQILNLEKESYEAELKFRVASKDLTQAQADQLLAQYAIRDALDREAVIAEEQAQRRENYNRLDQVDFDIQREKLESEAQLAETAAERRDIELKLLALIYRQERARLEAVLADEKSTWAAKEEARRRLDLLNKTEPNDRQGVLNNTRGPFEDWMAELPTTAAKMQEAFERLQVQGFEGLIDAALELSNGFDSAKKALLDTLKQFFLGLARAQLQSALGSILPAGGFKLPGFATGGFTGSIASNQIAGFVHGGEGVLNTRGLAALGVPNLNALNRGMPLSAISNDNGARMISQSFNIYANDADSFRRSQGQLARTARRGLQL